MPKPHIELRAKEVEFEIPKLPKIKTVHYHLYLIFHTSTNQEFIIRAGPKNNNPALGDIEVVNGEFTESNNESIYDYEDPETHYRRVQKEFETDEELMFYHDKAAKRAKHIHAQGYDYKPYMPPFNKYFESRPEDEKLIESLLRDFLHTSNCNTVASDILHELDIIPIVPLDEQGESLLVPGIDSDLEVTSLDKLMDKLDPTESDFLDFKGLDIFDWIKISTATKQRILKIQ